MPSRIEKILGSVHIDDLPRRRVCHVTPATTLGKVYELLDVEKSVAVLVEEEGVLVGIFTERDVLERTALEGDPETPIGELMTSKDLITLRADDRVTTAISAMTSRHIRHIPLLDPQGRELGMIGGRDVLRLIADYYPETLLNLPPRLHQRMSRSEGADVLCPDCGTDNIQGVDACEHCGADLAGLDLPEADSGFGGRLLGDRLASLKLSQPVLAAPDTTVLEVISGMRERRCGCTLIVDGDDLLVGIFDERDVLTRVVRRGLDPAATPVSAVMSARPLRLSVDDPPAYAVHCMVAHNYRHMAVLDGDRLVGYVSVRNILEYIHDLNPRARSATEARTADA